ncbi:MAG: DUF4175 family protein, partial [Alphaproteobacteria bacterium]
MSQYPGSPVSTPRSDEKDLAQLHLGRKLWLARLALAWERAWPALWPALGVGGMFIALGLFDVLPVLPAWLHATVLAAFAVGVGYALWRGVRAFRFPGIPPARRRIETTSGYAHRPLTLAADDIAGGRDDPKTRALWQIHRERVLARIRALRVGFPAPGLARLDPLALRGALILVLAIGTVVAWGDGLNRIARALTPGVGITKGPAVVDVWITPPAYTGMAPIFLSAGKDDPARKNLVQVGAGSTAPAIGGPAAANAPVIVPEGSTVLAQLSGGWGTPKLVAGGFESEFKPVADGTWKATAVVAPGTEARNLVIRQGTGEVASWPVTIRPD